jgi:hypothetical protein
MTAAEISTRVDELIASLEHRRVILNAFLNTFERSTHAPAYAT